MAELTKRLDTPILADESVFSQYDAMRIVKENAADVINIKCLAEESWRQAYSTYCRGSRT